MRRTLKGLVALTALAGAAMAEKGDSVRRVHVFARVARARIERIDSIG